MVPAARRLARRSTPGLVALGLLLGASACGSSSSPGGPGSTAPGSAVSAVPGVEGFPVTVQNCGNAVTFSRPPERVVLLKSASVPYLADLGVLDKVVSKAGQYPKEYYDPQTHAALDKIPSLTDKLDPSGHLQISKETVLAQQPDLVLGLTDTVNPQTLAANQVPLLEVPALCGDTTQPPGFDAVYSELTMYGKVFGRQQQAAAAADTLRTEVRKITDRIPQRQDASGAVLYPTVGGGTTYAYGNLSMADPQLRLARFANVFGDVNQRVFEISVEQLLAKDPDVIVLLHSEGSPAEVKAALTSLPGADRLQAVRNDRVLVQLFNFTEPPSPLALTGLESIERAFADVQ